MQLTEINSSTYVELKRSVSGFYYKFNQNVLRFYMYKIFDYDYLIESVVNFDHFEDYYKHHVENKRFLIDSKIEEMYNEAVRKNMNPTKQLVESCLIVRLGNIFNGIHNENNIIKTLQNLDNNIICDKASRSTDLDFKIDAFITIPMINTVGIQIKPNSFNSYAKGNEDEKHKEFFEKTGTKVHYIFYKDNGNVIVDGSEIPLIDKEKLLEKIKKILLRF